MSAIGFLRRNGVRLVCVAVVAANALAVTTIAGWESVPIHVLLIAAGAFFAIRPPRTIPSRDAVLFGVALTLATIGNELLEGIEPINDAYESWLLFALVVGLGWLALRRAQAAAALRRLASERERVLRRQERLMHDLSHELRTPATIARGHLEAVQAKAEPDATAAAIALDELARIDRIVERLLLLARAERGSLIELGEIQPEPFLEDVLLRWSEIAERAWRLGPVPHGSLRADPDALRIAVDALVENAVKYTDTADSIELRAEAENEILVIEVSDSGPGVPLEAADQIFARSARVRRDGDPAGHGIGLAIVDAIVRAHCGSCSVQPTPQGSRFAMRLPGYRAAEPAETAVAKDEPAPSSDYATPSRTR